MRCPSCQSENPENASFCIECGVAFERHCLKCGFDNPPRAKPYTSAVGLYWAATFHRLRHEKHATRRRADDLIALCTEQGFMLSLAFGAILGGSALVGPEREQG